jgi:NTP pyrophosphatase (non-canonical NTP hydrolase)
MDEALRMVADERRRQDEKWGQQRHGMTVWLAVLSEEVGEASAATLALRSRLTLDVRREELAHLQVEVAQVAAVAVAWLEHINEAVAAGDGLPSETWQ